eukprot:CAMPEP_0201887270 /NCGR_PEP_ID=MMETSP0902-20130614/24513_1 /ASSEMBLY_ACC=CAM_ASM_000551 /TAXON_ID=420261 /ORGANISM="Thalassiosira antarctica, Strain CCMP982" /LENGTH=252 /DNA_ID=CAMNT_0048417159 /DNA_START=69 /DNA_END=827 /DNA_ORIENTATION=+
MVLFPVTTAPARIASAHIGRYLLSRSIPRVEAVASKCSSHDVVSSPMAVGNTSVMAQQTRPISSMGRPPISHSNSSSSFAPPTYSALRNKVTMPSVGESGQPYASPFSEFFTNIEAGRTSLGTTEEMEQRAFEIQEAHLKCGIPESELRFKTTSYGRFALPPYVAPGEHRVIVKVALSAIPFENEQEKEFFVQIVGARYNKEKGDLQLNCDKFASRIENKRHLVDMIERIVSNARELAKEFAANEKTTSTSN